MKKLILLTLIVVMLFAAGCQTTRTPINSEQFRAKTETAGITAVDGMDMIPSEFTDMYSETWSATWPQYRMDFVVFTTVEHAVSNYNLNRNMMESMKSNTYSESSASRGNYSYYKLTTGGNYSVASRIENTVIYVIDAPAEYKDEINNFLQEIGY